MDQESAKKSSAMGQGTWRDKLGIKKELPKISAEFAPRNAAPERREPSLVGTPVRAGSSVKPAPMAPRVVSAPRTPAPQVTANTELAERIRQQREAAERMAEQRIAEAKDRAVKPAPPPEAPLGHEHQSARPRFSFADAELKPTRQEPPARAQAAPGRWTQMPQQRPMFSAERAEKFASAPPADPRLGGLPPGQRPPAKAGAIPYAPPLAAPAAPRRMPSPPRPAAGSGWGQGVARPRSAPPPVFDSYRRDAGPARGYGQSDEYVDEHLYRDDRGRADSFRDQNDYRGAHARELSSVEDQGDDLFEDEQAAPPRRADARDYNQAYREYEVTYPEEPRRRMGPFLLLLALLAVAAIAGGTIYLYQRGSAAPLLAKGEVSVPVVAGDGQPVKAEPEAEAEAEAEEPAASKPSSQQMSSANSGETSAQRKQIYDRILGETTLEEKEQLAPQEEPPLRPLADPNSGPSLDTQTDAASGGQALDAEPLPLPPPPGGSPEDETGGLDLTGQPPQRAEAPDPPDAATSPVPASATPSTTEQAIPSRPPLESEATPPTPATLPSEKPAAARAAAAEGSEEILSDNQPEQDLIVSGNSSGTPAQPVEFEPALSGTGPIQIVPQPGGATQPVAPTTATLPPAVPNDTTVRRSRVGRGGKSDDIAGTSVARRNFNRPASPQQVASIAPELINPPIAPEPAPQPVEQQAALPPAQPAPAQPATPPAAGPGFVMLFSSHRSEAEALAEFERLRQNHAGLIGSLSPGVRKTNLGSSGTRYQLSLGVVPTRDEARFLCSALFSAGEKDCIVRPR